jgi:hypothetical protein
MLMAIVFIALLLIFQRLFVALGILSHNVKVNSKVFKVDAYVEIMKITKGLLS